MQLARRTPITTYSRKKGRSRVRYTSSSPIGSTDREDLSLAGMSRRMKKRARQSINSARLVHEQDLTDSQKSLKRPKNTHSVAPTLPSDPENTHTSVFTLDP